MVIKAIVKFMVKYKIICPNILPGNDCKFPASMILVYDRLQTILCNILLSNLSEKD